MRHNPDFYNPFENPRRRKRRKSNPLANPARALPIVGGLTKELNLTEAGLAVGGLAAATMVPAMFMKSETTLGKVGRVAVAIGIALGLGNLVRGWISPAAGKAALYGGLAGAGAQAIGAFTSFKIGGRLALPAGRRIGVSETVSPPQARGEERVSIIRP